MTKLLTITLAAFAFGVVGFSSTASADAPSFDSDCVGTQWVIRNRGLEPFLVSSPAGEPIGMIEPGAVWEPGDELDSVVISNTVIIRGSCEALAPTPVRLPATGTSLTLAMMALALMATGAAALRVSQKT